MKGYKGYSVQLRMANLLQACTKRIDEFCKVSNNKKREADLLMYVLKEPFALPVTSFGTVFSQFDHKVAQLVRRLITIVTKKLHEDYMMDYQGKINQYLLVIFN